MSKQTKFQIDWLSEPQFSEWLCKSKDMSMAKCTLCSKTFNLSNMGRRAVTSHMNGVKHRKNCNNKNSSVSLDFFMKKQDGTPINTNAVVGPKSTSQISNSINTESNETPSQVNSSEISSVTDLASSSFSTPSSNVKSQTRGLDKFILNENITKSEILWCVETVMTHSSLRTASSNVSIFKAMFPDSEIAAKMHLQRDKICYMLIYGIAPFFQNSLAKTVSNCEYFVVGFDEALNKVAQKKQLDLNLRFWDPAANEVCTRYLTSIFLGKSTALDILEAFKKGLGDHSLNIHKILQISMDGPNVNHKFVRDLQEFLKEEAPQASASRTVLDLGSCGLHTLHGAFKTGIIETGWNLMSFLRSLYNLFKDTPARRAEFTNITKSTVFPKKFCAVRWVQNVEVADRALEMLPNIKIFVDNVKKGIDTTSFKVVEKAVGDPLLPAKLQFFRSVASDIEPFLRHFQSDWPMAPFLYSDLRGLMATQMDRIVKKSIMKEAKSLSAVKLVDNNLLPAKEVNIGFASNRELKKAIGRGNQVKDSDISQFRESCKKALVKFLNKMLEKCPLQFKLTRAVSCFDPKVALDEKIAKLRMNSLLEILLDCNWITTTNVDKVDREYSSLINDSNMKSMLKDFSRKCRLDTFWSGLLKDGERPNLHNLMKMVLTLSHGNANVERGFSVNKECIVENMRNELLVARRSVYDAVLTMGGVQNLKIEKALVHSARNAHSRYSEACKMKKKAEEDLNVTKEQLKRKAQQKLEELQIKKIKIIEEAEREAALLNEEIQGISGEMKALL